MDDLMPTTAGASAAGICGSLMCRCADAIDLKVVNLVWKAL